MDTAERVLASPRGRRFAAQLGYACSVDERASNYMEPLTQADVLDVLAAVDAQACPGTVNEWTGLEYKPFDPFTNMT